MHGYRPQARSLSRLLTGNSFISIWRSEGKLTEGTTLTIGEMVPSNECQSWLQRVISLAERAARNHAGRERYVDYRATVSRSRRTPVPKGWLEMWWTLAA